ncbi:hypothetical protein OSCI_10052 [Kamptonema sp. PCC 6506]|nr:hypothetical protein OSCI_10052 [Kamptonema sp. PCC 6506]
MAQFLIALQGVSENNISPRGNTSTLKVELMLGGVQCIAPLPTPKRWQTHHEG